MDSAHASAALPPSNNCRGTGAGRHTKPAAPLRPGVAAGKTRPGKAPRVPVRGATPLEEAHIEDAAVPPSRHGMKQCVCGCSPRADNWVRLSKKNGVLSPCYLVTLARVMVAYAIDARRVSHVRAAGAGAGACVVVLALVLVLLWWCHCGGAGGGHGCCMNVGPPTHPPTPASPSSSSLSRSHTHSHTQCFGFACSCTQCRHWRYSTP